MTCSPVRTVALWLLAVLLPAAAAAGLDIGVEARAGNLGFSTDRSSADTSLPGSAYFWGLSVVGSQSLSDSIAVETSLASDPVLRTTSRTLLTYSTSSLTIGVGPVFGLFNDPGTPLKPGLSSLVRLEYPEVGFVTLRADGSLGGSLVQAGDYTQERTDLTLGVFFPNAICTLSFSTRSFKQKQATQDVTDSITDYTFATEIYKKNIPYRLRVWISYEDISRAYDTGSTATATLDSVLLGTEVDAALSGQVTLRAGLEGNVYSFGLGTLVGGDSSFLFSSYAGLRMSLDSRPPASSN